MNIASVVLAPSDVPAAFVPMSDVSGPVSADQLFPGAAHGVRAVFVADPWVLTCLVTHFEGDEAARVSVEGFARVFAATAHDPEAIPWLGELATDAAGGVASGDPEGPGSLAMLAWTTGPVRCDLSLSGLDEDVSPSGFFDHEPATALQEMARAMAVRAAALRSEDPTG